MEQKIITALTFAADLSYSIAASLNELGVVEESSVPLVDLNSQ